MLIFLIAPKMIKLHGQPCEGFPVNSIQRVALSSASPARTHERELAQCFHPPSGGRGAHAGYFAAVQDCGASWRSQRNGSATTRRSLSWKCRPTSADESGRRREETHPLRWQADWDSVDCGLSKTAVYLLGGHRFLHFLEGIWPKTDELQALAARSSVTVAFARRAPVARAPVEPATVAAAFVAPARRGKSCGGDSRRRGCCQGDAGRGFRFVFCACFPQSCAIVCLMSCGLSLWLALMALIDKAVDVTVLTQRQVLAFRTRRSRIHSSLTQRSSCPLCC